MMHEPFYTSDTYANEKIGLWIGWVNHEGSFSDCLPIWNETRDICLAFSGEDFADHVEIENLRTRGHEFASEDASYLVHLYEEMGCEFFEKLNGWFSSDKAMLCFGQIASYKGLEYLIAAFAEVLKEDGRYHLIIAGEPKWNEVYWNKIEQLMTDNRVRDRVIERVEYVPDEETELYFKAADVMILPYTHIFQSGVLLLGYSFGLPVIAADVGSLKEEIIEGKTGFIFKSQDSSDVASKIEKYFKSDLFRNLEIRRPEIKAYANERYSWDKVAAITTRVYSGLLRSTGNQGQPPAHSGLRPGGRRRSDDRDEIEGRVERKLCFEL